MSDILKRRGIPTAPERRKTTTWKAFIRTHMDVLWATDFFTTEVWTLGGLVTYYILFFIHLETRQGLCTKSRSFIGFLGLIVGLSGLEKAFKMRLKRSY